LIAQLDVTYFLSQLHLTSSGAVVLFDVRSPKEFNAGHIPGAINLPLLNDDERHQVGITYKELGQEAAVKKGFELVGHKFTSYIDLAFNHAPQKKIFVYCWRGGLRSNIMAWLLQVAGFDVSLLKGGYKSFRSYCYDLFEKKGQLIILSGMTGSGKTDWLKKLAQAGEEVIDLEGLANHKGSAFGSLGQPEQHPQEHFENLLGIALNNSESQNIWIEDESRFIGKLRIPDVFYLRISDSPHVEILLSKEKRIERIISEYGNFPKEILAEKTKSITKRMGGDQVKISLEALESDDLIGWINPLLYYYDKAYQHGKSKLTAEQKTTIILDNHNEQDILNELISARHRFQNMHPTWKPSN
jgi:tRNA 2-selenouridine synthase